MSSVAHNLNRLPLRKLTFEEFLDWCDGDTRAEWVNGRVVILSPNNAPHSRVCVFLTQVLGLYVEKQQLGEIFVEGPLMRLRVVESARCSDIMFLSTVRASQLNRTYVDGAVDLAVEVISPDSIDRDRSEKFSEYQIAGVREYWIIDPDRKTAEFYELGDDKRYYPVPLCDGEFRSNVVPGFRLKPSWLWQDPPPDTFEVLRELGLI